ncbi:LysM peptidoglycan-binding domain-containing protein [Cellulomonas carbonis]|uniref:LysM domain-containing protein n=1 Tax=Cellulomonas carbonis T26 TaxID=947969 RepID=A0A0A0BVE4_9CELL|nr:LysM peptidoglycan-binding domain-containing protein [Cellulomonas carbonis]KGM11891.1 hypothetical protein N868_04945 [Cellulomonas carbonis T26]GGB91481.1 hypothetical protein GCM10010972_00130 [Cellulomonas carbonis]
MNPTYAPPRPPARTTGDIARGAGALLAVVAFTVGVPVILGVVAPLRRPRISATWDSLPGALTRADDGSLLLVVITVIAWAAWATFTTSVVLELIATARRIPAPSLPMLRWAQRSAAHLVSTAGLLLSTAGPVIAATAQPIIAAPAPETGVARPSAVMGAPAAMTGSPDPMTAKPTTATATAGGMAGHAIPMTGGPAGPAATTQPVVTVTRGDTLWSLAERHLGTGHRYTEIRDLNLGRAQPDGNTLTDAHWIYPGWQLLMPPDATALPTATPGPPASRPATTHEVRPGETLWVIAATHLGDGSRYPEILEANTGITQPDGSTLTDPDLIRPGWRLTIPTATSPHAPPPVRVTAPAAVGAPPPSAEVADTPVGAGSPATSVRPDIDRGADVPYASIEPFDTAQAAVAGDDVDREDTAAVARLFLGLTGLAAVGLIGELTRRRHLQHRRRRTGQRIALPAPASPADHAERTLRQASTPLTIPQLKQALQNLASRSYTAERDLPRITTLLLSQHTLELHLADADHHPIPPFEATSPTTWAAPTTALVQDEPAERDPACPEPYPALVTIGHTDDATVIVNLEAAGTLTITGDPTAAHDTLRAIVTELATSDLTGRIGLITGPSYANLAAAIDPTRLQCADVATLPTQHDARRPAIASVLEGVGADDTLQARSDRTGDDTWLPVIYVHDHPADDWAPPAPWSGSILLTTGSLESAPWTIDVPSHASARLEPADLAFVPQRLTESHLADLVDLLSTAATPDADAGTGQPVPTGTDEPTAALHALPPPAHVDHRNQAGTPETFALRINLLGPIEIAGLPPSPRPLGRRSTELLVYLALRGKATGPELDEVLWRGRRVDNQTRNSLLYRTRQRVGAHNLPPVDPDGHYRLGPDVTSDWEDFQHLARAAYRSEEQRIVHLQGALELVRDRPLAGLSGDDYTWADHDIQEIASAVVDAAHILATELLTTNDTGGALSAATSGLLAEPCSELLYDDAIRAARVRGDTDRAHRLEAHLRTTLENLDPDYVA